MKTHNELVEFFKSRGAVWEGHFVLASGKHSNIYIQCQKVLIDTKDSIFLANLLVEKVNLLTEVEQIKAVISPALGGVVIGYEVARQLEKNFLFTEKLDHTMILKRGFEIEKGAKYLVVEDVFTTGGSTQEVVEVVEQYGGQVVLAVSLVQRQKVIKLSVPHFSLLLLELPVYEPSDCPLCKEGIPINIPGTKLIKNP